MNRFLFVAVVVGGLLLGNLPEAAAHDDGRGHHAPQNRHYAGEYRRDAHSRDYYERNRYERERFRYTRASRMPKWLKRQTSFRRWYRRSPLKEYRFLTWNQLYDFYSWEHRYRREYRH